MSSMDKQKYLIFFLRLGGAAMLLAFLAIFMPTAWMDYVHQLVGLGPLPDAPLTQYLTRTISVLYAMHGSLFILMSRDVERFRPVITFLALWNMALGVLYTGIDIKAGLPIFWVLFEGPPIGCMGILLFVLNRDPGSS